MSPRQKREEERFHNLLGRHPAAVAVVSAEGRIVAWNRAAEEMFGFTEDEAIDANFEELLVPEERLDERREAVEAAGEGGAAWLTSERRHRNGNLIPVTIVMDVGAGEESGYTYVTMRHVRKARCLCGATIVVGPRRALQPLTARQRQVLKLIGEGRSTRDIAVRLGLSVKTIETHRGHLMQRLKLRSVAGLVRYAVSIGLVPVSPWATKVGSASM